jgi:hypothetical protein
MWRSVLAVLVGIIIGGMVVSLIEIPGLLMHPFPAGADTSDSEVLRSHVASAPLAALILVGIAWTAGPLVGSWLAASIARRAPLIHAVIVGMFFLAADIVNIRSLPHPAWLNVVGVLAPIVACWLGAWLAERTGSRRAPPTLSDMREKNMAC